VVIGLLGTVVHRGSGSVGSVDVSWWGVALAIVTVAVVGVTVRAWTGLAGLVAYGVGVVLAVQQLATTGPGGDVLVPAGQPVGFVWIAGSAAGVVAAALAPRRWFRDPVPVVDGPAAVTAMEPSGPATPGLVP
jgi:hypothetical protein